jgi:hypothetical protein
MAQYRTFERTIAELTAQGYKVIWERGNEAQLRRGKRFSFWWFLFWTVFSLGILFWLYPVWHWAKRDDLVLLRIEQGRLVLTSNRWQVLKRPACAAVVVAAVVLIGVIVAAAVTGGRRGGEAEVAGGPPAPKPNEATLAVGAAAELKDGMRLRIDKILDPCALASTPFQEVEPGTRMVVYQLTFENVANEQQTILGQFGAKDATGFEYDDTFGTCEGERDLPFCFLEDVVTTTECEVAFEVRESQQIVELRYDPNPFTTTDIVFRVP